MMADGLMSQAIANVRLAQDHLVAITGLPSAAAAVQVNLEGALTTLIPATQTAASAVLEFAAAAAAPMEAANTAVMAGDAGGVKSALDAVQSAMRSAAAAVGTATTGVDAALARLNADSQTLANVDVSLSAQIAQADGEADAAQGEADSLEKNKYYWLLLGPFGLVGLGICIGMLVDATNKVNGIRQHVSELKAQAAQWTKMQADVDLLRHDIPNLSSTLSSLQNALDFLGGDITEVVADVGNVTTHSSVARAFILTAGQQLAALRTDAS
jgi:hypothetical protein